MKPTDEKKFRPAANVRIQADIAYFIWKFVSSDRQEEALAALNPILQAVQGLVSPREGFQNDLNRRYSILFLKIKAAPDFETVQALIEDFEAGEDSDTREDRKARLAGAVLSRLDRVEVPVAAKEEALPAVTPWGPQWEDDEGSLSERYALYEDAPVGDEDYLFNNNDLKNVYARSGFAGLKRLQEHDPRLQMLSDETLLMLGAGEDDGDEEARKAYDAEIQAEDDDAAERIAMRELDQ